MKKLFLLPFSSILLFAFGDTNRESFSQDMKNPQQVVKSPILRQKEVEMYKVNKELKMKQDCLMVEIQKGKEITDTREVTIELQKEAGKDLRSLVTMANRTLSLVQRENKKIPIVFIAIPKKEIAKPLEINIKPIVPDSSNKQPAHNRTLLDKLLFRNRE